MFVLYVNDCEDEILYCLSKLYMLMMQQLKEKLNQYRIASIFRLIWTFLHDGAIDGGYLLMLHSVTS